MAKNEKLSNAAKKRVLKRLENGTHPFLHITEEQKLKAKESRKKTIEKQKAAGTYNMINNNPSKNPEVRAKISESIKKWHIKRKSMGLSSGFDHINKNPELRKITDNMRAKSQREKAKSGIHNFQNISKESKDKRIIKSMNTKIAKGDKKYYSKEENRLGDIINKYTPIKKQFRIKNNVHAYDIFIPEYNTIIEYDGLYWHKGREEYDKNNTEFAENNGYNIIRLTNVLCYKLGFENIVKILMSCKFNKNEFDKILGEIKNAKK